MKLKIEIEFVSGSTHDNWTVDTFPTMDDGIWRVVVWMCDGKDRSIIDVAELNGKEFNGRVIPFIQRWTKKHHSVTTPIKAFRDAYAKAYLQFLIP